MAMNPQITNVVIILFMMQAAKKIPFDDPTVLNGVRALYITSNLIIFGMYMYIQQQIERKKDMKVLKYTEPASVGSGEKEKTVTTTVHAYDSSQLRNALKSQLIGIGMMAFMHLYLRYTNPLVIQSIIPLKTAVESNLVKVHVRGQPAAGELARPWKAAGGMFAALQPGEVKTDKKSVEAGERAGRGGAKEE